ncbi:monovalent cation/H+ antiporter subunit D [Reyranella sp.]|uniref:monovalent cation/H+ antiporter subunit D n=1 Tax=Reyranella sp. TaxID=1929291 RepID=UPI003C7E9EC0
MSDWARHLIIAPIVLPLVAGALLAVYDERRQFLKGLINLFSTLANLAIAIVLLQAADTDAPGVYLLGNWPAPFGIVLVLDRLSAMLVLLTAVLATASLVFSMARWHTVGPHFHTLFQFLVMGVNGAFLTGDLFNLFVFFEVMLASSYGLLLHGSGPRRVQASVHYVVVNLTAAFFFLVGVALIYGVTGTLNMADLASRIPALAGENRILLEVGAAILGMAFLVKAAMWPLGFWLLSAYPAAAPPVAAIFAILSKVGLYALLRLRPLLFGSEAGEVAGYGATLLFAGGLATIAFGILGVLASQAMTRIASFSLMISSGTVLAAIGLSDAQVTGGALFYLVSSTLTISAFFLLIELIERGQNPGADLIAVTAETLRAEPDEEAGSEGGMGFPGTLALLGAGFTACALLLIGLPPLSGFVAKLALLAALFAPAGEGASAGISPANWVFIVLLLLSGVASLMTLSRVGIRAFWAPVDAVAPRVLAVEAAPVFALLLLTLVLAIKGGPVMQYMEETARSVLAPASYIEDVLSAPRVPPAKAGLQ